MTLRLNETLVLLDQRKGQKHQFVKVDFNDFSSLKENETLFFFQHRRYLGQQYRPSAGGALDKSIEDYQAAFDLLFKCAVHHPFGTPALQQQQWGRIINVASISVREPLNYLALSNSLRAALVTWAKVYP